jgi:hypothetical protein
VLTTIDKIRDLRAEAATAPAGATAPAEKQ